MNRACKKNVVILLLLMLLCNFLQVNLVVKAYEVCGYKLKGTWYDDYYYTPPYATSVTYGSKTVDYASIAKNSVDEWNSAINSSIGHSLDIALTKTADGSSSQVRVVVSPIDRGATGWRGFTYYSDYNSSTGVWSEINPGGYPNKNYQAGSAVINIYYVHSDAEYKIQLCMR